MIPRRMSLRGCRSVEEAVGRIGEFLDKVLDDQARAHGWSIFD
jgi:hypothetical protein